MIESLWQLDWCIVWYTLLLVTWSGLKKILSCWHYDINASWRECSLLSTLARGFEWGIYSRNVCAYVRTYLSHSGRSICAHVHAEELIHHVCTETQDYRMPSNGGQGRTALLDNGGRVGQCDWSSAMYIFCGVEYWTQPTVGGIEIEIVTKSMYSRR